MTSFLSRNLLPASLSMTAATAVMVKSIENNNYRQLENVKQIETSIYVISATMLGYSCGVVSHHILKYNFKPVAILGCAFTTFVMAKKCWVEMKFVNGQS